MHLPKMWFVKTMLDLIDADQNHILIEYRICYYLKFANVFAKT